jgi:putative spermidine/putrescine transport system ATP-binding protein
MNQTMVRSGADAGANQAAVGGRRPLVRLIAITKKFGPVTVLDQVSLDIAEGEFFTFLGPSGSGKTTTLRLISGFDDLDGGRIEIDGRDVADIPPFQRDVNTVFQDYALFPHMTVLENIAYGPLAQGAARPEAMVRARAALAMVQLSDLGARRPGQLSGGQRQRIAVARAVVNRPRVLLLDEPLVALDLKLRHEMQFELKRIQRETGITFIYVTHDQEEALAMSDRIAVFNHGRVAQVGAPDELYDHPASPFVAGFVGVSNFLVRNGQRIMARPEKFALSAAAPAATAGRTSEPGAIVDRVYLGMVTRYLVRLDAGETVIVVAMNGGGGAPESVQESARLTRGARVWATWSHSDVVQLPQTEGEAT